MLLIIGQVSDNKYVVYDTSSEEELEHTVSELEELSNSRYVGGYSRESIKVYRSVKDFLERQKALYKLLGSPLANFEFDYDYDYSYDSDGAYEISMFWGSPRTYHLDIDRLVIPKFVECLDFSLSDSRTMNVNTLVLNDGLKRIGDFCFFQAGELKTVNIPDSVSFIGTNAFMGVSTLTKLVIGSGVQVISAGAFRECGLESVIFKESDYRGLVIDTEGFAYNRELKELILNRSGCSIEATAFHESTHNLSMNMKNYLERHVFRND